jgi:hypothetical protein
VLTPEMAGEKLREMRIFMPPEVVMTIVKHLNSGGKQNVLYRGLTTRGVGIDTDPPTITSTMTTAPVASNNTVLKIKKLLDAGTLYWMTDELANLNVLLEHMEEASDEDQQRNISQIKRWEIHKDEDGLGNFRLRVIKEAEEPLKGWGWSVINLERIGIPLMDALGIIKEFDGLLMARTNAEVIGSDYSYLLKFRGFDRYLYLHHLVYLMRKYPNSPYKYASKATDLYTGGYIEDESLWTAGEDILRYGIWRKGEYLEAYYESLKRYRRTQKRNAALRDQIDHLLNEGEAKELKAGWGEAVK